VKLIDAFEDHSSYCMVLEYIPSGDLCNYIQSHGPFEYERARRYAKQITLAVQHLHDHGYCHLDLSLENILLDERTDTIKLCDFGLSRKMLPNKEPFAATSTRPGKKSYVAPEVYTYSPFCGDAADIFSLGVIYFILLCGFPPFHKPCVSDPCFSFAYDNDVGILLEKWQSAHLVRQEGIDLLNKIFVSESKRINMQELLEHPFWTGVELNDVVDSSMEVETQTRRIKIVSIHEQNCNGVDNNNVEHDVDVVETINLEVLDIVSVASEEEEEQEEEQCEMKLENEQTSEDDDVHNWNLDLNLNLESHCSRSGDVTPQDPTIENTMHEVEVWDLSFRKEISE